MLIDATNITKSVGSKNLFPDLSFSINEGEKIALIGRNGQGKTTLLKLISGEDKEFDGQIKVKKGIRITMTQQEHHLADETTAIDYILGSVPQYQELEQILHDFENGAHTNINAYSKAVEMFSEKGYYHLKDRILHTLIDFQISEDKAHLSLANLSGGEKRYVELARMMYSQSQLYLIDEPTNHMDYIGKEEFINWMNGETESVIVVTHDRDVLKHVDKIYELKDKKLHVYNGNFDHYIANNATNTTNSVKQYLIQLNKLKEAKKRVEWGLAMRAKSKEWKVRYDHWLRDYEKLKAETIKPSFWIDQESTESLGKDVAESYHKFKEKNIRIAINSGTDRTSELVTIRDLSLGYTAPLFAHKSFLLRDDNRVFIKGRNGAGKSSLVRTIMSFYKNLTPQAHIIEGKISLGPNVRIGEYEQEISSQYLHMTLDHAIEHVYAENDIPLGESKLRSILSQYLFDPVVDGKQKISSLSGGQKARFQIIKMLAAKPNLLILDEPTNHLDLPSIEELENALDTFTGGILYISHDTYFINHVGGEVVEI